MGIENLFFKIFEGHRKSNLQKNRDIDVKKQKPESRL